jgi:tRNA(Ile2) C34 agmatinyltransferase TiaS
VTHQHEDSCPYCEGPMYLLGQLGKLIWKRCRNCGLQTSTEESN